MKKFTLLSQLFGLGIAIASLFPLPALAASFYTFGLEKNPRGDGQTLKYKVDIIKNNKQIEIPVTFSSTSDSLEDSAKALAAAINAVCPGIATAVGTTVKLSDIMGVSAIPNSGNFKIVTNKEDFLQLPMLPAGDLRFLPNPESGINKLLADATITAGFNDGTGGLDLISFDVFAGTNLEELASILNDNLSNAGYVTSVKDSTVWVFADGSLTPTRLDFSMSYTTILQENERIDIAIDGYVATPEPTSTISLLALGTLGAASTLKRKLKPSKPSEKETTKVS